MSLFEIFSNETYAGLLVPLIVLAFIGVWFMVVMAITRWQNERRDTGVPTGARAAPCHAAGAVQ